MTPFDPLLGERIAPAWLAAAAILRDGEQHALADVLAAMLEASDVQPKTCANVLRNADRAGWVFRSGPNRNRTIRVTAAGQELRAELTTHAHAAVAAEEEAS